MMKIRIAMYLAVNALLALLISALHAAAVMESDKSLMGEEAPAGQLRDHNYYKAELQKLEESTARIHEEVDRILKEFRKNMEEYYQRTRGAAATTTFAEFKPQPLANDVEGGNNPPNLQLLPQEVLLPPAPGIIPPLPSNKVPPPPINKMGEWKKYNKDKLLANPLNPKPEKALGSGSVVSSEGIQEGLGNLEKGDHQQSASGLASKLNDEFSSANLSANTRFLHKSTLEGVDEKEWEAEDNSFEPKVQEKKPEIKIETPKPTDEEMVEILEKEIVELKNTLSVTSSVLPSWMKLSERLRVTQNELKSTKLRIQQKQVGSTTDEEMVENLEKEIAELKATLDTPIQGDRKKLEDQLEETQKALKSTKLRIQQRQVSPPTGGMPIIQAVGIDAYIKEREKEREKENKPDSWTEEDD
jgi:hypothetical protein